MNTSESRRVDLTAIVLVVLNVIGILLGYALTMIIARSLSREGFEQYVGAVATLGLLASIGEAGFGKYGLQIVPLYVDKLQRSRLAGYFRFAVVGCVALTLVLGLCAGVVEIAWRVGRSEQIMLLAIVFLPAMALSSVVVDLLLAFRLPMTATVIARFVIPAISLIAVSAVLYANDLTVFGAILCYGGGSLVASVLGLALVWRQLQRHAAVASPKWMIRSWTKNGIWFFLFGFANAWFFKATFFLLHHIPDGGSSLAMLAPAFETGCLILLVSKSTDKFFQPSLAVAIDRKDWMAGSVLRKQRFAIVGAGIAAFLFVIFRYGERILGWYGGTFSQGYPALRIVALGASVWTLFSMAPTFLLFSGRRKSLFVSMFIHAVGLGLLTVGLLDRYGYLGAAIAFSVSISSLSLWNLFLAQRAMGQAKDATV